MNCERDGVCSNKDKAKAEGEHTKRGILGVIGRRGITTTWPYYDPVVVCFFASSPPTLHYYYFTLYSSFQPLTQPHLSLSFFILFPSFPPPFPFFFVPIWKWRLLAFLCPLIILEHIIVELNADNRIWKFYQDAVQLVIIMLWSLCYRSYMA